MKSRCFGMIVFALLLSPVARAADVPNENLQKKCAGLPALLFSARQVCADLVKDGAFDSAAADFCFQQAHDAVPCLRAVKDAEVSAFALKACAGVEANKGPDGGRGSCLEYFGKTPAKFDDQAVAICMRAGLRKFQSARGCLNAIRDREVDTDEMKACLGRSATETLRESTAECLDRALASAPLRADACSGPRRRAADSGEEAPAGVR